MAIHLCAMAIHLCAAKKERSLMKHYQCAAVVTHCYATFCSAMFFFEPWMGTLKPFFGYTCSPATRTRYPSAECTWSSCDSSTRCFTEDGVNYGEPCRGISQHQILGQQESHRIHGAGIFTNICPNKKSPSFVGKYSMHGSYGNVGFNHVWTWF